MSIAERIETYLAEKGIEYYITSHAYTQDSLHTAEAARVSGEQLAKAVVLKDGRGYLAAVLPATFRLKMGPVHELTGRKDLAMVEEDELSRLFQDCAFGAVPALAAAYGLDIIWDDALAYAHKVYFEGGDHMSLIRVSGADFRALMGDAPHGEIGEHF